MDLLPAAVATFGEPVLRTWTAADVPAMADAVTASLEHLRPWMPWVSAEPLSPQERAAIVRGWEVERLAGGDAVYGMFATDGRVVGGCGLHRRLGPGALEIGYWVSVDCTRRGLATRAAAALTTAAFAHPGVERVEIHHDRANAASRGVPRRLGFTVVSERPEEPRAPGEEGVEVRWRVTRAEWVARLG